MAQMSLAFILQQPFISSCIIGATNMPQLEMNIASNDVSLSGEVLAGIDAIHARCPNPCP
jgi:aryl-alcohol dehydrogenase-like predicted oxidoreductase